MPTYKIWNPEKSQFLSKEKSNFDYSDGNNWRLWDMAEGIGSVSTTLHLPSEVSINDIATLVVNEWDGAPVVSPPLYKAVVIHVGMYDTVETANKDGAFHHIPDYFEGTECEYEMICSVVSGMTLCVGHSPGEYKMFWFDGDRRYTKDRVITQDTVWIKLEELV